MDINQIHQLLNRTYSHGGEFADIYFEKSSSTSLVIEDGKVESVVKGIDKGLGIRLVSNGQTSYGYSNDFNSSNLSSLADTVGKIAEKKKDQNISSMLKLTSNVEILYKKEPESIKKILAGMMNANNIARSISKKIKQVKIIYMDLTKDVTIATSDGTFSQETKIYTTAIIQVVASDGKQIQTSYEPVGGLIGYEVFDEYPIEIQAETAARRAIMLLGARPAPSGRMSVILSSEAGGTMVHEAVGHGLEADLTQGKLSAYAGKKGEQVASSLVTVVDDGTLPNKRGSFMFDDEAVRSQRTTLIDRGILKSFMYDRTTASKDKTISTGNGRRQSYRFKPIPRMTNTFILPGDQTYNDIISSLNDGIYVKKMGGGQVNTVNGDFVFEVNEGYIVRNGTISEPIRGATLTGNGPEVLKNIQMVGSDIGFAIGTCGKDGQGVPVSDAQPTLLIDNIVVGGMAS